MVISSVQRRDVVRPVAQVDPVQQAIAAVVLHLVALDVQPLRAQAILQAPTDQCLPGRGVQNLLVYRIIGRLLLHGYIGIVSGACLEERGGPRRGLHASAVVWRGGSVVGIGRYVRRAMAIVSQAREDLGALLEHDSLDVRVSCATH